MTFYIMGQYPYILIYGDYNYIMTFHVFQIMKTTVTRPNQDLTIFETTQLDGTTY